MEDDTEDEEDEEFDFLLFTKLMDAREAILKMLLQNREVDICVRMGMVLNLSKEIQIAVDHGELFQIDELLKDFGEMDSLLEMQKQIGEDPMGENEYCSEMRKMFRTFSKLEVLKEDSPEYVRKAERLLFGEGQREYLERRKAFHKAIGLKSASYDVWSCLLEQLMVYFVFTYFCGAVYDDHILGKMQTAVVSTILIQELAQAVWQEKQEAFTFMDFVDVAHRYSREIEHSDINLLRLEKLFDRAASVSAKTIDSHFICIRRGYMRLIHTADWHLGKHIEGHSRLEEQELFLEDFVNIVKERDADVVLIAGDIYDSSNPPAKAEQLFYDTLKKISDGGRRLTIVIAGNHDNPERLVSATPLAMEHGIIMVREHQRR